ncbi:hypothetical protein [Mesorhizobium sp. M0589]|uniref:hypothetical protein n=1 Tax=Mesorhizobium sp. M0589 TaxID=2956965 RepID=UPI00333C4E6E
MNLPFRNSSKPVAVGERLVPLSDGLGQKRLQDVAAQLRITARAAEAGSINEPKTADATLDDTQQQIINQAREWSAAAKASAESIVADAAKTMRNMMPDKFNFNLARASVRRAAEDASSAHRDELDQANEDERRRLRERNHFEHINGLIPGSAIYSNKLKDWLSWLFLLAVAEMMVNALFLQEASDYGFLGGFAVSAVASVLNIASGTLAGLYGWRLLRHVRGLLRVGGAVVLVLAAWFSCVAVITVAHYQQDLANGLQPSVQTFKHPEIWFDLNTLSAFCIVLCGTAMFVFAMLKAKGGENSYFAPYYQHEIYDRRYGRALKALLRANAAFRIDVQNVYAKHLGEMRGKHVADQRALDTIRKLAGDTSGSVRTLEGSIVDEHQRVTFWLRLYRDNNRQVRTSPAPAYFDQYPSLSEFAGNPIDLSDLSSLVVQAAGLAETNGDNLAAFEEAMLDDQAEFIGQIEHIRKATEDRVTARIDRDDQMGVPASEGGNNVRR